jgi:hypothetical protein
VAWSAEELGVGLEQRGEGLATDDNVVEHWQAQELTCCDESAGELEVLVRWGWISGGVTVDNDPASLHDTNVSRN